MSYLARLKERLHREGPAAAPTKPTKGDFVGFVGGASSGVSLVSAWLEGLGRLRVPERMITPSGAWPARRAAAEAFTHNWGEAAHKLGWTASELYSLHSQEPLKRLDAMGAAFFAHAGRVTAVTGESIALEIRPGRLLSVRRPTLVGPPAWEVFAVGGDA